MDQLLNWVEDIDHISERSLDIYNHLGWIIPERLKNEAKEWFKRLPALQRVAVQANWGTMRTALLNYFVTPEWLQDQQQIVLQMRYRQRGHENEKPINYFYQKKKALELVYNPDENHFISEIFARTPDHWAIILDRRTINSLDDLRIKLKEQEEALLRDPFSQQWDLEHWIQQLKKHSGRGQA